MNTKTCQESILLGGEGGFLIETAVPDSVLFGAAGGSVCVCVCVMGVFPSVERFQGPLDNMEFIRGMPHKGSFLSPDSITSCFQLPWWFGKRLELMEEPENQDGGSSGTPSN